MKLIETSLAQKMKTLGGNAYFADLPEPLLKEIAQHTQLREYQRGDILFWEADPCDGLHIIETGSAKIYRLSPQGRQYIVRILQEGDTFAEVPAGFDGGLNPVNVDALETCRVWVINSEKLRALVLEYPIFAQKVLANFGGGNTPVSLESQRPPPASAREAGRTPRLQSATDNPGRSNRFEEKPHLHP